jgi:hypothetical protein
MLCARKVANNLVRKKLQPNINDNPRFIAADFNHIFLIQNKTVMNSLMRAHPA